MYTQIPRIDLTRLPNAAFLTMMFNLKRLIEKYSAEALGIGGYFVQFDSLYSQAMKAMEAEHSSSFTIAMEVADLRRDDDYRVFYYFVKAFTFSGDAMVRDAATQVMRIIRDGANPLEANRDQETTLLENLYNKLMPEPYTSFLDTLQARVLLDTAVASNNVYKDLYAGRNEEQSAKAPGCVKDVRVKIYPVYRGMIGLVNSNAAQYPDSSDYEGFTAQVAEEVKHNKTLIAQHEAKNKERGRNEPPVTPKP